MRRFFFCLLLSALALGAAELSGKWSGSFDITNSAGETKNDTAYMDLKEQAGAVTGTAGPNSDQQWPVLKGKLDGQKLKFEVQTDDGGVLVLISPLTGIPFAATARVRAAEGRRCRRGLT
jgi:hypothetical protein